MTENTGNPTENTTEETPVRPFNDGARRDEEPTKDDTTSE